ADQMGLKDTRFANPHGLDAEGHHSTAFELAKIGAYALNNEIIKDIVGTKFINMSGRNMTNTNELLGFYDGVYGLKTGFTNKAGRCLVTSAKRGEVDVVTVVLNCPTKKARTSSSIKILDYVFENYEYYPLVSEGERFAEINVKKGIEPEVGIVASEDIRMLLANHSVADLKYNAIFPNIIKAPVEEGTKVGNLQITENGLVLLDIPLVTSEDVGIKNVQYYLKQIGITLKDMTG
ncbi:MAG TPA: D-alanyl-D-alanine carboxypeptidase, partial [Clostridiales bacterium]|nr:D-alanyl-D-alanine carboxypeptidase [Clostridiales bacterium]